MTPVKGSAYRGCADGVDSAYLSGASDDVLHDKLFDQYTGLLGLPLQQRAIFTTKDEIHSKLVPHHLNHFRCHQGICVSFQSANLQMPVMGVTQEGR